MPLMQIELHRINIADPSNDHAAPPVLDRCRNPFFHTREAARGEPFCRCISGPAGKRGENNMSG